MDSSQEVQRAALQSIGRSRPSGLISTLVDVDPGSPLLQEYQETLVSYRPTLFPQLRKLMKDKKKSRDQKKLIIKIADMVGGPLASEMLSETAHGPDLVLRFASIKGMNRLKKNDALAISEQEIESLLEQELEALKVEIQRIRFIGPLPNTLIDQVLRQREKWTRERIFRVLGLLYDSRTIYHAYLALDGDDRRRRESALELLDTLLKSDHRQEILSLIETRKNTCHRRVLRIQENPCSWVI